jgi:hypothetical protein
MPQQHADAIRAHFVPRPWAGIRRTVRASYRATGKPWRDFPVAKIPEGVRFAAAVDALVGQLG